MKELETINTREMKYIFIEFYLKSQLKEEKWI